MILDLLPIGSVVKLKGGEKRLMITGIKQTTKDNPDEEYDYLAVLYPEGHVGDEYNLVFNHDDIETVFFRGFEDFERQEFIRRLDEYYNKLEGDK